MSPKPFEILIAAAALLAASSAPAHAYLDPGTGSMILQGLIGGAAAGLFFLRTWWARLLSFLPGRKPADPKSGESAQS